MDFDLTEEQRMLQESVRRYVERSYTFERRRKNVDAGGFSRDIWRSFAEMGWLAARIPEHHSGLGFSPVETALIAEELGRGLVLEPYTMCCVLPTAVVGHYANESQKEELYAGIASGDQLFALAVSEPEARGAVERVATTARKVDGGFRLDGKKSLVVGAPFADRLLVVARTSGDTAGMEGVSLFVLDATTPGVRLDRYRLLDGTPAADLCLDAVLLPAEALLGDEHQTAYELQRAVDEAIVSLCAETVGGMEDVIALTADYVKTRKQFGVAIGRFQVLQHRLADMAIDLLQGRATLNRALAELAQLDSTARSVVISGCKAQVTRSARFVTAQGIQLHGGYGITEEYRVGHHYRRLIIADAWFGNLEHHLNRYARHIQETARTASNAANGVTAQCS